MTIDIELDGRRRQVSLRREGDQWLAGLDGREVAVTIAEVDGPGGSNRWSMLLGSRTSYDIGFEPTAGGELLVHVNGAVVPLVVAQPHRTGHHPNAARRGRQDGADAAGTQPRAIVAPMPGRIVKVLVKPGEDVQARQGLVVVEAMKMENELRAPRSGTVAEVRVAEGASVEANAVLVVLR